MLDVDQVRSRLGKENSFPILQNLAEEVSSDVEFPTSQKGTTHVTKVNREEGVHGCEDASSKDEGKKLRKNRVRIGKDEEDDDDDEEFKENSKGQRNSGTDREENLAEVCDPFSVVETKMEVNEKELIDPSRYVIVMENQKKKSSRRTKTRKNGVEREKEEGKRKGRENRKKKQKKNFICDICREELGNEEELNSHRRLRHINEKSEFFCDFCLKIFKTKAILKGHRYKHITDPQYLCVRCGKKYFTISNLNEHSLYCLDEKKFECPVCKKKFNVNKQFKRHLVIHEAARYIKCTVCEQTFSRKDNYRQHFRRHTGEKPYTCDICGKSFRIKATYNYHRRTHRDSRPGDLENLKTENANLDGDFAPFKNNRKNPSQEPEYGCPRMSDADSDFPNRFPQREADFEYGTNKDWPLIPEYSVKSEPTESEYAARKDRTNSEKQGKKQKPEEVDYSQRLNVDCLNSIPGSDYSKRDSLRFQSEYYPVKNEYSQREIPPLPEYLSRRVNLTEDYHSHLDGPDSTSRGEPEYSTFPDARAQGNE